MKALSVSEIEEIRVKILANARELIEAAELLFSNRRYARTYTLAHLACEEMAKIQILVNAAFYSLTGKKVDWTQVKQELRSHIAKFKTVIDFDSDYFRYIGDDKKLKILEEALGKVKEYNDIKNLSLYASWLGETLVKPSEIISSNLAKSILSLARSRLKYFTIAENLTKNKLEQTLKEMANGLFLKKIKK